MDTLKSYLHDLMEKVFQIEFDGLTQTQKVRILQVLQKRGDDDVIQALATTLSKLIPQTSTKTKKGSGQWEDDDHAICYGGSNIFPGDPGPQDDRE